MILKRERGCVPAFLFYEEGSEIMAENDNHEKIKKALIDMAANETPEIIQKRISVIVGELQNYIYKLNDFYSRVERSAKTKLEMYDEIDANEITTSYGLYKELKGYDTEAFEILKEGYVIIDEIRTFFTGEEIVYDVGFTYKGTLYEIPMTIEQILEKTKADYNTRSKLNDLFKLRMSVRKGDLVQAYNETHNQVEPFDDGSSTI